MNQNILIAGVGGQGTILAAKIIGKAAAQKGLFVRASETIGMAQRGGSVVSHVRIGSENSSSIIPMMNADLLIAFEPAEAARNLCRLKPEGTCVVNSVPIIPVSSSMGNGYPLDEIIGYVVKNAKANVIDAYSAAEQCGTERVQNIVLLGAASWFLPFESEELRATILQCVPPRFAAVNLLAFETGRRLIGDIK